jgi:hypothetical protein
VYRSSPEELKRIDEETYRRVWEDEIDPAHIIIDRSPPPDPDEMRLEDYPERMHKFILQARANKAELLKRAAEAGDTATAAD